MGFIIKKPLTEPNEGGYWFIYYQHWWVVDKDGNIVFWQNQDGKLYPQCNANKNTERGIFRQLKYKYPAEWHCRVKYFEKIYEKIEMSEILEER
jgi:hypothetical protein